MPIALTKKVLLLDAAGAALSAFLLGVVLRIYQSHVGIPDHILLLLAGLAVCFFVIDMIAYFAIPRRAALILRCMAIVNICYALLSLGLALIHRGELTLLGWVYVIAEIAVLMILSRYEWRVASNALR